ncbi:MULTISPECIES: phosphopantetheine-binding protein [Streptomyces]|uniref:Phosphopantetheine-binding protein n=1 Tax=Streptomyces lichenis TaxID=2306967 RepID=A0ABT0IF68_9ACTN|nr:phosphopantetheine-binding protein [Streptomyces lichenis]MCK8679970.1 phosphopantetheine-binding protein [Streptomyces lichenis]
MDKSPNPTEQDLRETLAPLLGTDPAEITPDANLVVLGLSSLELMRLVSGWRRAGVPAQFDALVADPTLNGWLAHFAALAEPSAADSGAAR